MSHFDRWAFTALAACVLIGASCATATVNSREGELLVTIEPGSAWLHEFSALQRNAPQFALWAEREDGSYAGTVFATRKVATEGWAFNGGNRRKESLPAWGHKRGIRANDGIYLPTKEAPLTDAVCGATPKAAFAIALAPETDTASGLEVRRFYLYAEFNHSTDFDAKYPKDAKAGEAGYSGGEGGSGQPSIVYRALVDLDAGTDSFVFETIGHGSPDGSDGAIDPDLNDLSDARDIVSRIVAERIR